MLEPIQESTFLNFAMRHYDNPGCHTVQEFQDDLERFKYLNKLFNRYDKGELKERLILNHVVVLFNIFGKSAIHMLLFRIKREHWRYLFTFLVYLGHVDECIEGTPIRISDYGVDVGIVEALRRL